MKHLEATPAEKKDILHGNFRVLKMVLERNYETKKEALVDNLKSTMLEQGVSQALRDVLKLIQD